MNIDGTEEGAVPYKTVDAVAYWDVAGSLNFGDFRWSVGADNVLDKIPPYLPGSGYNANMQVYDHIGRYFWTKVGYTFH